MSFTNQAAATKKQQSQDKKRRMEEARKALVYLLIQWSAIGVTPQNVL